MSTPTIPLTTQSKGHVTTYQFTQSVSCQERSYLLVNFFYFSRTITECRQEKLAGDVRLELLRGWPGAMGRIKPSAEDWSPRRFYRTMLYVFRRRPGEQPVTPPFYEKRPLAKEEFEGAQALYVTHALSQELGHLPSPAPSQEPTRAPGRFAKAGQLLNRIHSIAGFNLPIGLPTQEGAEQRAVQRAQASAQQRKSWELYRLAMKARFADTAEKQSHVRRALRARLRGRPTPLTQLLRKFLQALPQAKAEIGWQERLIEGLIPYRAERGFLWSFLREEVRATEGKSLKHLKPEQVLGHAQTLHEHYPYLMSWSKKYRLTVEQIQTGLLTPRQADDDAAKKFQLSAGTVRSHLSQFRRGPVLHR